MKLTDLFLDQTEWIEIKTGKHTVKLLVRSLDNDDYRIEQDRIVDLINKQDETEEPDDQQPDAVVLSRINVAHNLLCDWQGVDIPYDPDLAVDLFKNNSAIFAKVVNKAREIQQRNDSVYDDTKKK